MDLLRPFLIIMALLWVAWFVTGGPESGRTDRPFIQPLVPAGGGNVYGPRFNTRPDLGTDDEGNGSSGSTSENGDDEIFRQSVSLGHGDPDETEPAEEYVVIEASRRNTETVTITGWTLRSAVTGSNARIGEGARLPYLGRVNVQSPIKLKPGEEAIVVTGRSPIGTSFRLNACTGYFEQFQDFEPRLPERCPRPRDEVDTFQGFMPDACYDYVQGLRRCETYVGNPPVAVQGAEGCVSWLNQTINYNGCVRLHEDDGNFYDDEWRVYLGKSNELWREDRETIRLEDASGRLVDSVSY